ncbi:MAG: hypothetical protein ACKOAZ_01820 [Ilumatobacteraceae bacterium]
MSTLAAVPPLPTPPVFQWSELARRAGDVGSALDAHGAVDVVRGAQTLRLGPAASRDADAVVRDLCSVLAEVAGMASHDLGAAVLEAAWPWTRALPPGERVVLLGEVGPLAEMCASLGTFAPLIESLADWRRTARAWADGAAPVRVDQPAATAVVRPSA